MSHKATESKLNLFKITDFDKRFLELTGKSATYEEAYEKLESEFSEQFGSRRYKNYESFRKSRVRRIRQNLKEIA
jgi:hypothetical protein